MNLIARSELHSTLKSSPTTSTAAEKMTKSKNSDNFEMERDAGDQHISSPLLVQRNDTPYFGCKETTHPFWILTTELPQVLYCSSVLSKNPLCGVAIANDSPDLSLGRTHSTQLFFNCSEFVHYVNAVLLRCRVFRRDCCLQLTLLAKRERCGRSSVKYFRSVRKVCLIKVSQTSVFFHNNTSMIPARCLGESTTKSRGSKFLDIVGVIVLAICIFSSIWSRMSFCSRLFTISMSCCSLTRP